jgi:D-3-phosphoglycerate dehydrogenase
MKRLNVLFLMIDTVPMEFQDAVVDAISPHHNLTIFDPTRPIPEQFAGQTAVIDIGGSVGTNEMKDAAVDTKFWQIMGTGLDHVDIDYMKAKGFMVSHCPGQFSAIPLAECALMYMLMLSRNYHQCRKNFDNGELYWPLGYGLSGRVLGIVGFGASGQELARRAKAFNMRIHTIDVRDIEPEIVDEIQPEFMGGPDDMDKVIAESDFLSVHLHLNDETRHIIDARRIALMKSTAFIINVARGGLVDEAALYEALLEERIAGAGLDAFAAEPPDPTLPVYQLSNVVVTPHTSGTTDDTVRMRTAACLENVNRVAEGLEPLYRVDQ